MGVMMTAQPPAMVVTAQPLDVAGEQPSVVEELFTANDLARWWKVPKSFIYLKTTSGELEAVRVGRYLRYTQEAGRRFMAAQQRKA